MKDRIIERKPPAPTGNPEEDVRALTEYIEKLQEEINFILRLLYKRSN